MGVVMDMSSYEIERNPIETEETVRVGWNPEFALACQQQLAPCNKQTAMSADLAMVDVELFLEKMHAYQR